MPGFVLMSVEGVLSDNMERGPLFSRQDPDGVFLYHALAAYFIVVLSSTWTNEQEVKHWLVSGGVTLEASNVSRMMVKDRPGTAVQVRERHLLNLKGVAGKVSYLIDSMPEVGAMALRHGVRPLISPTPIYSQTSLRPDAGARTASWAEVEAERQLQLSLTAQDLPAANNEVDDVSWDDRGWLE